MKNIFEQIKRFEHQEFTEGQSFRIVLQKVNTRLEESSQILTEIEKTINNMSVGGKYEIEVKKYMLECGTPTFDFMTKFNNDISMPLCIMQGTVEKETRGMWYMNLVGKAQATKRCMCCGRPLTNPISMLYGIGPECGKHFYINPYDTEEELREHIEELKNRISDITWEGWVIKSAIKEFKEVEQ